MKSAKPCIVARRIDEKEKLKKGLREAVRSKSRIIFIDETIFLSKDNKLKAWSSQKQNIKAEFPGNFQPNTCVVAAMDSRRLVYYEKFHGYMDQDKYLRFLMNLR